MKNNNDKLIDIKKHWESMAIEKGVDLTATTKTSSIKKLEINAICKEFMWIIERSLKVESVLEVGCGNGFNLRALNTKFPQLKYTGVDFIPEMISSAKAAQISTKMPDIEYYVGDILNLDENEHLREFYDIVFTDRCVINLPTQDLQMKGLQQLAKKISMGGYIILIENFVSTYDLQNRCRELIGLSPRIPDSYNKFLSDETMQKFANSCQLTLHSVKDFASLHDLLLYVLLAKLNDGKPNYDHPLMDVVTDFSIAAYNHDINFEEMFGQNRLYLFEKL